MADSRRETILDKRKISCCARGKNVFKRYRGRSKIQEPNLRGSFSQICDNFNI